VAAAVFGVVTAGCGGGGSPASNNVPHPLVRQFSPTISPINFNTGQADPTFTDGNLTVSTDPAYPGKIVIFFQADTVLDPKTVFIGGNPALGIDLSALQVLQFITGTGNIPLAAARVEVLNDKIIFTPAVLPLPDGQYSIGVFANLKSVEGDPVDKAPVFHSFTVGAKDTTPPEVVTTIPVDKATGVGAGLPPPPPPAGVPSSSVADIRTAIFGPTSPDIIIRFNEEIAASSVTSGNVKVALASQAAAGISVPGPAPGYPKLRSEVDQSSLPSNGFEVVWKCDQLGSGFSPGASYQVTVKGADGNVAADCIKDRSGLQMTLSYNFTFSTVAAPPLPADSEPEFSVYFTTSDSFGVIDCINQFEIGQRFISPATPGSPWTLGTLIAPNQVVPLSDTVSTKQTLGNKFDPLEVSVDCRTNGTTGHTWAYVQSFQSGQVFIINTRTSLPAAIINTPSPGGLANQTGGGTNANVLIATNSSANTMTIFNMSTVSTGVTYVTAPITIQQLNATGNTPKAVSITSGGDIRRDPGFTGPSVAMIMYADFTDGVVSTANLGKTSPVRQFALGTGSSPNDISFTPCYQPGNGLLMYAAISEGGTPGNGKVSYYVAGPGCQTGVTAAVRPDNITGDLSGFDAPAGLDCVFAVSNSPFFAMAESGSTANHVVTLNATGAGNLPGIVLVFDVGANPVALAHRPPVLAPSVCLLDICASPPIPGHTCNCTAPATFLYGGAFQGAYRVDQSLAVSRDLYVCVRGAGRVEVLDFATGRRPESPTRDPSLGLPTFTPCDKIPVPGVRMVNTTCSQ
jgi:hypothetical protein